MGFPTTNAFKSNTIMYHQALVTAGLGSSVGITETGIRNDL